MTRRIVAIGGTIKPGSSTERALAVTAAAARDEGAEVVTFDGAYMARLPHYRGPDWTANQGAELIAAVLEAGDMFESYVEDTIVAGAAVNRR